MADDDAPEHGDPPDDIAQLGQKLDTIAGAMAAVATTQNDLLARLAQADARRGEDTLAVAQRLDALERQVLGLAQGAGPGTTDGGGSESLTAGLAELTETTSRQRDDLALALEVLARMADTLERSDARTEDRLAAVRDAAAVPVSDLQAVLSARADRTDAQLADLVAAVEQASRGVEAASERIVEAATPTSDATDGTGRVAAAAERISERVEELAEAVRSLSWQLPEITEELAGLRGQVEAVAADVARPAGDSTTASADDLVGRLTLHTDTALAGVLRLIDDRLRTLRAAMAEASSTQPTSASPMGFEAGAVMGAAQAAWNRLEQRLDTEFDDLGRQLQSMGTIIEQALATAEAAANRPVVTGDQLRRAATSMKDTVLGASKARRDRRGGPRGLGPGGT